MCLLPGRPCAKKNKHIVTIKVKVCKQKNLESVAPGQDLQGLENPGLRARRR